MYDAFQSRQVRVVMLIQALVVVLLISVQLLFRESQYVVRGPGVEQHESITPVVVCEWVVVLCEFLPGHVLLVDVRQSQQLDHLGCVNYFYAYRFALPHVPLVAWSVLLHVDPCATALVPHFLEIADGVIQRQPALFQHLGALVLVNDRHGPAYHEVMVFLFAVGVIKE